MSDTSMAIGSLNTTLRVIAAALDRQALGIALQAKETKRIADFLEKQEKEGGFFGVDFGFVLSGVVDAIRGRRP